MIKLDAGNNHEILRMFTTGELAPVTNSHDVTCQLYRPYLFVVVVYHLVPEESGCYEQSPYMYIVYQ